MLTAHDKRVLKEYRRFEAALPRLMRRHRGRWVVFLDGEVTGIYDDDRQAFDAGVKQHGYESAFLIARVQKPTVSQVGPAIRLAR